MAEFEASEATDGRYDSWLLLPLGVVLLVIYTSYRCFIYASELTSQREQEQRKYRRKLEEKESYRPSVASLASNSAIKYIKARAVKNSDAIAKPASLLALLYSFVSSR